MDKPGTRSRSNLRNQLVTSAANLKENLLIVPRGIAPYTTTEVYNRFLIIAPDIKGNAAAAFGDFGVDVNLSLSFKFSAIAIPILSLKASADLSGSLLRDTLLMVHRSCPKEQLDVSNRIIWKTGTPVTFMTFKGYKLGLTTKLSTSLNLGKSLSKTLEGMNDNPILADLKGGNTGNQSKNNKANIASIGIGGTLSVTGSIGLTGEFYRWEEDNPGFYSNGMDSNLKTDFENALGPETVEDVGRSVKKWLDYLYVNILDKVSKKYILLGKNPPLGLETLLTQLKNLRNIRTGNEEDISAALGIIFFDGRYKLEDIIPRIDEEILEDLAKDLTKGKRLNFRKEIAALIDATEDAKSRLKAAKDRADSLKNGEQFPSKSSAKVASAFDTRKLCFINMFIFKPEASAGASAWLGASATLTLPGDSSAKAIGGSFSANIDVKADFRKVSYRYQTYGLNRSQVPLMLTQDTNINYSQVRIPKSASLDFSFAAVSKSLKLDSVDTLVNTMSYNTASLYWLHPGSTDGKDVQLQTGSGLSFGFSLPFTLLIQLARKILKANNANTPLDDASSQEISKYAHSLKLTAEIFTDFLLGLFSEDDQAFLIYAEDIFIKEKFYPQLSAYDSVLIESSLEIMLDAKGAGIPSKLHYKNPSKVDLTNTPGIENIFGRGVTTALFDKNFEPTDLDGLNLKPQAIRLRLRLKDNLADTDPAFFKLGFFNAMDLPDTPSATEIIARKFTGIFPLSAKVINKAGNEGILDFHTYFIPDGQKLDHTYQVERGVPPVNLIPHGF